MKNDCYENRTHALRLQHHRTTSLADLLISELTHPPSLHNARSLKMAVAKQLRVPIGQQVNNRKDLPLLCHRGLVPRNQLGEVVQVDRWLPRRVLLLVIVVHAALPKVSGMVLPEVNTVMVLTASITAARGVLAVFADAAVATERGATLMACLLEASRHVEAINEERASEQKERQAESGGG
uniref:Uncharacterized protein TCIL3000_9_4670 n=1 Tax=Trypanosoma congolense (strain IL3000) TaxID=1068625 RepID=G0UUK3_TRYCI|nr:unnamed protein product [Trypanosoma congolense IL3000]